MTTRQPAYTYYTLLAPGSMSLAAPQLPYKFSQIIHADIHSSARLAEPQNAFVLIEIYNGIHQVYAVTGSFNKMMRMSFNLIEMPHNMPPILGFQGIPSYEVRVTSAVSCSVKFQVKNT